MKKLIDIAIEKLKSESGSLVAVRNENEVHFDIGIGVKPIMNKMRENKSFFKDCVVADKVIGKAAALLLVLSGVKYVFGIIMSESAVQILEENSVGYSYDELVPYIKNRTNTGMCPLEDSVKDTTSPTIAFGLVEERIKLLMAGK